MFFINDSTYWEEISLAEFHASEIERLVINQLINCMASEPYNIRTKAKLHAICESIKRRVTGFDSVCDSCGRCNNRKECVIKWFKNENNIEGPNYCCSFCENYKKCRNAYKNQHEIERVIEHLFYYSLNEKASLKYRKSRRNFMKGLDKFDAYIEFVITVEKLREDILLKNNKGYATGDCCEECPSYAICAIKWRRNEKGGCSHCCSHCEKYRNCDKKLIPLLN